MAASGDDNSILALVDGLLRELHTADQGMKPGNDARCVNCSIEDLAGHHKLSPDKTVPRSDLSSTRQSQCRPCRTGCVFTRRTTLSRTTSTPRNADLHRRRICRQGYSGGSAD